MAKTVSMRQQKLRLLDRLFDAGIKTDAAIMDLQPTDMLKVPDITTAEIRLLIDLQDSVRNNTTITFLGSD